MANAQKYDRLDQTEKPRLELTIQVEDNFIAFWEEDSR